MQQYDDLDRALFALPLEETPADLRSSILAITVRAPQPERAKFGLFENLGVGFALAALAWLTWAVLSQPGFAGTASQALSTFAQGLSDPRTLLSLAIGFTSIFLVSLMPNQPARVRVRAERS